MNFRIGQLNRPLEGFVGNRRDLRSCSQQDSCRKDHARGGEKVIEGERRGGGGEKEGEGEK